MVASFMAEFQRGVSPARFAPYLAASSSPFDGAITYFWNITLSEALYPALAAFEIALRNTLHDTLTARQQGNEFWFREILEPTHLREYATAHAKLISDGYANPSAGKVVAELKFWFWTSLLSGLYQDSLWKPNRTALLRAAFPNMPRVPNNRHFIYERCNDIRQLRNRVMHHEPIWKGMAFQKRGAPRTLVRVDQLHAQIVEGIAWINPTIGQSIAEIDRFDDLFQHGRSAIEANIKSSFGLP